MKGNVVVSYGRRELQDGCAINNNAGKNMQRKNAVVNRSVVSPMFISIIAEVFVFGNQFIQKEAEEGEPKKDDGNFL